MVPVPSVTPSAFERRMARASKLLSAVTDFLMHMAALLRQLVHVAGWIVLLAGCVELDTDPDLLLKIRNLIAEAAQAGPMPVTLNLALTADTWLRGVDFWERIGDGTLAFQVKHTPAATVAIAGNATATARAAASAEVTSPAAETHSIDYQLWAAVLLCIIGSMVNGSRLSLTGRPGNLVTAFIPTPGQLSYIIRTWFGG
jgi:hypothetical protein